MPKVKSALFGKGHKLFRGKKSRNNSGMFRKGGARAPGKDNGSATGSEPRGASNTDEAEADARASLRARQGREGGRFKSSSTREAEALRLEQAQQLQSTYKLGSELHSQGKLGEAEALLREALEGQRALLGGGHADTRSAAKDGKSSTHIS